MAELTVNKIPNQGCVVIPALTAADNVAGDTFLNNGSVLLFVQNTDAADQTVTIEQVKDEYGRACPEPVTIPAGEFMVCGPFLPSITNQIGGKVLVNSSAATVLLAAAEYVNRQ